jgi:hypothetical protein
MSLIELIVAAGIFAGLALVIATVGNSILRPLQNLNKNVFGSIATDLSVRSLNFQLTNSDVMHGGFDGSPWVKCAGKTALDGSHLSQSTTLQAEGDAFTFAFAQRRTLGTTSLSTPNSILVPDASIFIPGMNILVSSLDGQKNQGLFAVNSVDLANHSISLDESPAAAPGVFGCSFSGRANASVLFNPLQQKKFAVQTLGLVRYEVAPIGQTGGPVRLIAREWPFGTSIASVNTSEIVGTFKSLTINEKFTPSMPNSMLKGVYVADLSLDRYSVKVGSDGKPIVTNTKASAGYTLSGVEIANQGAVPAPPSVDNLFVTCMLTASPMMNDFIDPATGKVVSVYRLDAFYSESETVNKSSPQIVTGFTTTGSPIQCWSAETIDCSDSDLPMKLMGAPTNGVSFKLLTAAPPCGRIDVSNSLVMPAFCAVPSDTQTTTSLTFRSEASAYATTINCSNVMLEGLKIAFSYAGNPSSCSKDGSIYLGRLVNNKVSPPATGPVLGIKTNGCTWKKSSSTSCNAYKVLQKSPDAELSQVQLTPEDLNIEGGSTLLKCL